MKQVWTVYTVESDTPSAWSVIATQWTELGPQRRVVKARLVDMTRAEAEAEATRMQRGYDETRQAMGA